ncbi:MAG TPA: cytochrome ubiquinol oxidase subunit I [Candidatus Hydrogenedens sp.]|nr:cytochrome ubiquinol oxidase subunit I [Candidatus Hydrogenedens sp.]HOL18822.1 cytochrome ubiquinol oxidase subunit I [Candidatus Hydrogenedens sp.]HPP59290.1 cytochrome ubiquinol oxidase subunit I [Candidatus Hydrogenedens sp.]
MLNDALMLARIQFALTAIFHYLYPPLTIGLGWIMAFMSYKRFKTEEDLYDKMSRFWTGIFAITFAMGVTTGIVMEFEFGTNWSEYSRFVGDVFGSPLAAEALISFFLESTFLGILVFGWNRVSKKMHFFATLMVALGATLSALWIIVANSWQQTPAGYHVVETALGPRAEITNFWQMFFNYSTIGRFSHVIFSAIVNSAFVVMSISAYYLLKGKYENFAKYSLKVALVFGCIGAYLVLLAGHHQAIVVSRHQPAKLAAFEGHFKTTGEGTPFYLFGIPNEQAQRVDYGVAVPGFLSFLVYFDFTKPVTALDQFPPEDRPPVALPFFSFHIMAVLGMFFILLTTLSMFLWWRGTLFNYRWLLWIFVFSFPLPYIANMLGWIAAEVGRQPWIVQNLLRTKDGISPGVSASQVLGSMIMFTTIYSVLFILYIFLLLKKIKKGPEVLTH